MKTESAVLILVAALLYYWSKQQQSNMQRIDCNSPQADPVMCQWLEEQQ